jgi:hypothetical protein
MQLREYLDAITYETAFWAAGLDNPDYPINQYGGLTEDISDKLRTLAIVILLVEADTDLFYHNLIRSGRARVAFLQRCRRESFSDYHVAVSRTGAFFDSLAAGDFELASEIAKLSPREWIPEGEYQDDYCFTRFFHLLVQNETQDTELAGILAQYKKALDGGSSAGLDLCHAFAAHDQKAFDAAIEEYIAAHDHHLDEDSGRMEDTHVVAERQIFVEGLGVLRAAERFGLKTQSEYRYCPTLARLPMTAPFPG